MELRERDLMKSASLSSAIATELEARGASSRVATFAARCAVAVFGVAYDAWADEPEADFTALITATADDLQKAIGGPRG